MADARNYENRIICFSGRQSKKYPYLHPSWLVVDHITISNQLIDKSDTKIMIIVNL
jgi:hypothetical protein